MMTKCSWYPAAATVCRGNGSNEGVVLTPRKRKNDKEGELMIAVIREKAERRMALRWTTIRIVLTAITD